MTAVRPRLAASERRASVLEVASRIFAKSSYRGTTTAEIAREAGVTEPILYRHFESKRDLYLACLDDTWERLHSRWEKAVASEPDPKAWLAAMARAYLEARGNVVLLADLWIQALAEANDDSVISSHLRQQMKDVHRYVRDLICRSQAEGGILRERDADAEAWVFISIGVLGTVGRRLGGLIEDDLPRIKASRREWMTGLGR